MAFNPDEYMAKNGGAIGAAPGGFNPNQYLQNSPETNVWNWMAEQAAPLFGNKPEDVRATIGQINQGAYGMLPKAAMGSAQDYLATPASLVDAMGFTYPKKLLRQFTGMEVPEPSTTGGKIGKNAAGAIGFLKNPVFGVQGGAAKLWTAPLRTKIASGALTNMMYPGETLLNPFKQPLEFAEEKASQGAIGAGFGAAAPMVPKLAKGAWGIVKKIPGLPEGLAAAVSDITQFSKNTIRRIGPRIFNPNADYAADDYIGTSFVPQFREHLFKQIETLGAGWEDTARLAKFKTKEIERIRAMSPATRKAFVDAGRAGQTMEQAVEAIRAQAGAEMDSAVVAHNKPIIINNFVNSIKRNLLQSKWAILDKKGRLVPNLVSPVPHDTRQNLINLYEFYKNPPVSSQVGVAVGSTPGRSMRYLADAKDFQYARSLLEKLYTGNPEDDRVIAKILKTLIVDAKGSGRGIPGYRAAAQKWFDARTLEEIAPKLDQWSDPVKLEAQFSGINAVNARSKYNLLQNIKEALPKKLYDDLSAHYTIRNFDPNFTPSMAGLRKFGITQFSRMYYRNYPSGVNPLQNWFSDTGAAINRFGEKISPVTGPLGRMGKAAAEAAIEPSLSPGTRSAATGAVQYVRRSSGVKPGNSGFMLLIRDGNTGLMRPATEAEKNIGMPFEGGQVGYGEPVPNPELQLPKTKASGIVKKKGFLGNERGSFVPFEKLISGISKDLGVTLKGEQIPMPETEVRPGMGIVVKPTDFYSSIERFFDSAKQSKFDSASFKHIVNDPQKIKPIARDLFNLDELVKKAESQGTITKEEILAHVNAMKPQVYPFIQDMQDLQHSYLYGTSDRFMERRKDYLDSIREGREDLAKAYQEYKQSASGQPHPEANKFKNISQRATLYGNAMIKGIQRDLIEPVDAALSKAHARAYEISQRSNLPPPQGIITNEEMTFLENYQSFAGEPTEAVREPSKVELINKPGEAMKVQVSLRTAGFSKESFMKIGIPEKEAERIESTMQKYNKRYSKNFVPLTNKLDDIHERISQDNPRARLKGVAEKVRSYRQQLSKLEEEALDPITEDIDNTEYASHLPDEVRARKTFESLVLTPGYKLSEDNPKWAENLSSLVNPQTQRHFASGRSGSAATVYSFTRGGNVLSHFPGDSGGKPAVMAFEVQSDPINIIGENPHQVAPISKITAAIKQHIDSEKNLASNENLRTLIAKFQKANRILKRKTGFYVMSPSEKEIMKVLTNPQETSPIRAIRDNVEKKINKYYASREYDWHERDLLYNRYNKALDMLRDGYRLVNDIRNGDALSRTLNESLYIESPYTHIKANLYKEFNAVALIKKALNTGVDRVVLTPPTMATMQWGDKALGWKNDGDRLSIFIKDLSPKTSKLAKYLKNPITQTKVGDKSFLYQRLEKDLVESQVPYMGDSKQGYDHLIEKIADSFSSSNWNNERRVEYANDLFEKIRAVKEGMIMPHYQRDYILHETTSHENVQRMLNNFGIKMERVKTNVHPDLGGEQESWGFRLNDAIKKAFKDGRIPLFSLLASMLPTLKGVVYDDAQLQD